MNGRRALVLGFCVGLAVGSRVIAQSSGTYTPGTYTPGAYTPGSFSGGTYTPGTYTPGTYTPGSYAPSTPTFTPSTPTTTVEAYQKLGDAITKAAAETFGGNSGSGSTGSEGAVSKDTDDARSYRPARCGIHGCLLVYPHRCPICMPGPAASPYDPTSTGDVQEAIRNTGRSYEKLGESINEAGQALADRFSKTPSADVPVAPGPARVSAGQNRVVYPNQSASEPPQGDSTSGGNRRSFQSTPNHPQRAEPEQVRDLRDAGLLLGTGGDDVDIEKFIWEILGGKPDAVSKVEKLKEANDGVTEAIDAFKDVYKGTEVKSMEELKKFFETAGENLARMTPEQFAPALDELMSPDVGGESAVLKAQEKLQKETTDKLDEALQNTVPSWKAIRKSVDAENKIEETQKAFQQ